MPKKQVDDFDNPDQGDKDEYGLKFFSDHGDQEPLSPMKYRFQNIVLYSEHRCSSSRS
ncbi:MAG: hypothetical protein IID48_13750 [Proteobacteria bacterium]|nr:hypothetical protein [Pseudomonadota bacterium]